MDYAATGTERRMTSFLPYCWEKSEQIGCSGASRLTKSVGPRCRTDPLSLSLTVTTSSDACFATSVIDVL